MGSLCGGDTDWRISSGTNCWGLLTLGVNAVVCALGDDEGDLAEGSGGLLCCNICNTSRFGEKSDINDGPSAKLGGEG